MNKGGGFNRRTVRLMNEQGITFNPEEILDKILEGEGWNYKSAKRNYYHARDKAMISLTYLSGCRISEVLRLTKEQFEEKENYILVSKIKLSKSRIKGKPRKRQFRIARLPLSGERAPLTKIVSEYLLIAENNKLFISDTSQAHKIFQATIGLPAHWLRALCEDYIYYAWNKDIVQSARYFGVDERTFLHYMQKRKYLEYQPA